MKSPTDLELLDEIYNSYYSTFVGFSKQGADRSAKIYVPVDCDRVAKRLGVDGDIVFGRLYYHLEKKYGYEHSDGVKVPFFTLKVGEDKHCVNFPMLASVLAGLREDYRKFQVGVWISVLALVISVFSLTVSALT